MQYEYTFNKKDCWFKDKCNNFGKEDKCNEFCKYYKYLHYQAKHSLLTTKQQYPPELVIRDEDKEEYKRLVEIRENIFKYVKDGNNLVLMSNNPGNGKTTWMTKLAMSYMAKLYTNDRPRVLFVNCARFCLQLKHMCAGYTQEDLHYLLDNIEKADLVIWDDLAVTDLTSYDYLSMYTYINYRMDSGKSNFFTLNHNKETLLEILRPRLYSRIIFGSEILQFKSTDFRCVDTRIKLDNLK